MPNTEKRRKGFTLTEIMVVTAIITLIIGIAVPNLLRMKASASQTAAIKTLRTLNTAFSEFWQDQTPHRYPTTLAELASIPADQGAPAYVDSRVTDDNRYQGYYFSVVTPDAYTYSIQATPVNSDLTGNTIYAVTEAGTILVCHGGDTVAGFLDLFGSGQESPKTMPPGHPRNTGEVPSE